MGSMPPRFRCGSGNAGVPALVSTREFSDRRRGSAHSRGYNGRWAKARLGYLAHHPLCCCHLANGLTEAATVVDHVQPHDGNMLLFWDSANWQPLCKWCHDTIKQALESQWLQGRLSLAELRLDRPLPRWFGLRTPGGGCFL